MRKWLFSVGWVLFGFLGVAALLVTSGRNDLFANPQTSSYGVSGTSALADLLRLKGYDIVVDQHPNPVLKAGDAVIAFQLTGDENVGDDATEIQKTEDSIRSQVGSKGATVFWLPVNYQFEDVSQSMGPPVSYKRVDNAPRLLSGSTPTSTGSDSAVSLVGNDSTSFIDAVSHGKGYEISYGDAIGLTNRFLDRGDNAQTFLEILQAYDPKATRVVFTEGTFGKTQPPGFLETLGPWAEGSFYQLLFFFLIIIVTLNQRFGLPIRLRRTQTGGRQLINALADTMYRARSSQLGLETSYQRADRRVRSIMKMPKGASEGERDRILPPDLQGRLAEVKAASQMDKVHPSDALDLVIRLEKSVDELANQHGTRVRPARRRTA